VVLVVTGRSVLTGDLLIYAIAACGVVPSPDWYEHATPYPRDRVCRMRILEYVV